MQKVRRHPFPLRGIGLRPLVSAWFQVLLTQLMAVLFIVQSPYLFTIGHRGVFSLGRWSAQFHTRFHEPRATLVRLSKGPYSCRLRDFHPLWWAFPGPFGWERVCNPSRRPQPRDESRFGLFPLSLAATDGIDVSFFSCGYLDVSVPHVRSSSPIHSAMGDGGSLRRVSAFRNPRINVCLPTSRGLSQAATSFVASRCQDIHHAPLRA